MCPDARVDSEAVVAPAEIFPTVKVPSDNKRLQSPAQLMLPTGSAYRVFDLDIDEVRVVTLNCSVDVTEVQRAAACFGAHDDQQQIGELQAADTPRSVVARRNPGTGPGGVAELFFAAALSQAADCCLI